MGKRESKRQQLLVQINTFCTCNNKPGTCMHACKAKAMNRANSGMGELLLVATLLQHIAGPGGS